MEKKKKKKKLPVEVNEKEFVALLEATPKLHHKVGFLLAWQSGLRVSEVIDLKPEHINVEDKRIFVCEGKGGKDRIVGLPIDWMPHLINYIPIPCSIRALQAAFYTYAKKSGMTIDKPGVHFHSLRHGFATHMIRNGAKISSVQMLLGHNDLATTSRYIRLSPDEALKDQEKVW